MLGAITLLLVYQTIGEIVVQTAALPMPGPVIGRALLFVSLVPRGTARGKIGIEQLARAIDRAVIVQGDGLLQGMQGRDRLVVGLRADPLVEIGRRVGRVEITRNVVLLGVERAALFFSIGFAEVGP